MDIEKTKAALEKRFRELADRAEDIDEQLSQPGDDDWAENAAESEGDEVQERVGDMALNEMEQIKRALARIEAGTFGTCLRCGKPIAEKRIEVLPYATQCVECQ